ncbi:ImmA/IrrE family metallo-endopeptidase [Sulfuricurvum sp.]|uniref:ImmA/IrrE family metallo-endopeptidase n=1 Tax=Sulfuricurvum sp. TaxID=2025608 RepID=UPI003BB0C1B5
MRYQDIVTILRDFTFSQGVNVKAPMDINEELIRKIGTYLNFNNGKYISVLPIESSSRLILGKLRHFSTHVEVLFNDTALNPCWRRYIIVKELFHLLMSKNDEGITEDIDKLVDGLFNASFGFADDIDHEYLAVLFAADFLLPYDLTQAKIKNPNITATQIAEDFKAPKNLVDLLSMPKHIIMRDEAYKDL